LYGPTLTSNGIALRAPAPEEIAILATGWQTNHDIDPYVENGDRLGSVEGRIETLGVWRTSERRIVWLIQRDQDVVGMTNMRDIEWIDRTATTGMHVYPRFRRQGIATAVVAMRARYAFAELGLNKLHTDTWDENVAMKRALLKAGYREVGIRRKEFYRGGTWHDMWLGELLREDWERRQTRDAHPRCGSRI